MPASMHGQIMGTQEGYEVGGLPSIPALARPPATALPLNTLRACLFRLCDDPLDLLQDGFVLFVLRLGELYKGSSAIVSIVSYPPSPLRFEARRGDPG